jgi:DNA-binding FadR family transcriptional regulator
MLKRPSRDSLFDHLTDEIMSGKLAAGSSLPPERELAQQYGLSRPTVREVLRSLQERGLVDIVPARGTYVREATSADGARSMESVYRRGRATARDLVDARLMLETHAARLAAIKATKAEVNALEQCMIDCENAENPIQRALLDATFHGLLAKASHNPVIETMFGSIAGFILEHVVRSNVDPKIVRRGNPYHRVIVEALKKRSPDDAEEGVRVHLRIAAQTWGKDFDLSLESVARRELNRVGANLVLDQLIGEVNRRSVQVEA